MTQSSKPVEEWRFRCDSERDALLWTRLLHMAMHITNHPTMPQHTKAFVPLDAASEHGKLAIRLGLNRREDEYDDDEEDDGVDDDDDDDDEEEGDSDFDEGVEEQLLRVEEEEGRDGRSDRSFHDDEGRDR